MAVASFEKIFEKSPNAYILLDRELRYVAANQAYLNIIGKKREEIIGRRIFEVFPDNPTNQNSHAVARASFERVFRTGEPDILAWIPYKMPRETAEGVRLEERHWSATNTPITGAGGEVDFILQHAVDISALDRDRSSRAPIADVEKASIIRRVQAVQQLNISLQNERRRLLKFFEQAPGFIAVISVPGYVFELVNQSLYELVGHRELLGRSFNEALPELASQTSTDLLDRICRTGEPFIGRNIKLQLKPRTAYVDLAIQAVHDPDGSVSGILVQGNEVTRRVIAEQELRRYQEQLQDLVAERTRELEKSQAALQQAHKMEAVGRLTGGVAHDFNNLLQVIAGNLQLAQRDLTADNVNQRRLQNALNAVDRGARLASQLLAFARRQPLEPKVVNLGQLVEGLDDLLRQALGAAVKSEVIIAEDLWNTFCDPSQLENTILNLAINAHDAMEGKGKLTIEVLNTQLDESYTSRYEELQAGDYVALVVSDTGCGMSPEVLKQVFEPFFSTKSPERGTGLGLSMVYGFVKQSGGHISIYSEEGVGTAVKIYLPRSMEDLQQERAPAQEPLSGGSETILVVEDDDDVRETTAQLLDDLGYRTLRAADAASGLAILQSGIPVDLLFTDVVMPGTLPVTELARQAQVIWPECQVLFTSGYTEPAMTNAGWMTAGANLISKPYRQEDLARKIRQLLDEKQHQNRPPEGGQTLRVLVVEDAVDVRQALSIFLRSIGHEVVELGTAEAALNALAEVSFEVLITDVSLPGVSGLELAKKVERSHPEMAIIIASGYDRPTDDHVPHNYRWLQKPYDFNQLETALKELTAAS